MSTITLTFGDVAENHVGMEKIGTKSKEGYSVKFLKELFKKLKDTYICEIHCLNDILDEDEDDDTDEAVVLVIRNFVNNEELFEEQSKLIPDDKYYCTRRKQVLNKRARQNLCFGPESQDADFENGKGTIIKYDDVPKTKELRDKLMVLFKEDDLKIEGNYYDDVKKNGIGYHGDTERSKVIGIRLGNDMKLCFVWYERNKPISGRYILNLKGGDAYIMSHKATGHDWKKSSKVTLRHAAGADKFINIKS